MDGRSRRIRIVDLTRALTPQAPSFPGDPPVSLSVAADHPTHGYRVSAISLGSHSGTHIDAPSHFFPGARALSDYPVDRFVAPGVVIDCRGTAHGIIDADFLAAALSRCPARRGDFVLLWTQVNGPGPDADSPPGPTAGMSRDVATAAASRDNSSPGLSREAAALLLAHEPGLVGIDTPSIDTEQGHRPDGDPYPAHRLLLSRDILIAENLCNLGVLGPGRVQCAFLPLYLTGVDGAPVRAIARRTDSSRREPSTL